MEALVKAIQEQGTAIGRDIVKVDKFLNHRIDTNLMQQIGASFADAFREYKPNLVLTLEASGIAVAYATACALGNLPMVYAKKNLTRNVSPDAYMSGVYSYTHAKLNTISVQKKYISTESRVLIIDDFLANGEAALGMLDICTQAGASVIGFGACIEKVFQPGRSRLEDKGLRVVSLAKVNVSEDGVLNVTD